MRSLRCIALCSALGLGMASGASAADPPKGSDARAAAARRSYEEGVAAAAAKDWQHAYTAFAEAWRLKQHWQIAVNLGQAELRVGKFGDAAEHIAYYLREATELHAEDVKQARQWLDQAKAKAGAYRLSVAPAGAQVFIDNRLVGTAPFDHETYVDPGWHLIEARTDGAKALKQVEAPVGQVIAVRLGAGVPEPVPTSEAAASDSTASSIADVRLSARGGALVGGAAFAAINLAVGIAAAVVSTSKGSQQDALCAPSGACPASASVEARWVKLENERVGVANLSVAGFVIAGLAAGGAVAAFVLIPPKSQPTSAPSPVSLRVSPAPFGLTLSGSF